ncbi:MULTISPECIES: hypothetical protein [Trueperella]|uniref:Uncharacterized protein n=1 Tax=Trueperella bernardiae TaxID=59561 RepID=A0A0W1KLK2_9ACTO|nr:MULTISPECIES: hypothetical protein [Trueperella]KTF04933.1 hypothetical protein AQZ59_00240 [Trueperella bernardiae]MDV6238306.1 hypothetical protein [Trueperella bernardiae]WIM08709.1 hypothetical protein QPC17_04000 [Trueperella bernardiae]
MRISTAIFGSLSLILASTGIARAAGAVVDVRIVVVIMLFTVSALLAMSAFRRVEPAED